MGRHGTDFIGKQRVLTRGLVGRCLQQIQGGKQILQEGKKLTLTSLKSKERAITPTIFITFNHSSNLLASTNLLEI